jgi:hypothetical protein
MSVASNNGEMNSDEPVNIALPPSHSQSPLTPLTPSPSISPETPPTPISHQSPDSLPDLVTISNSDSESDSFSFAPHNRTTAMSAVATTLLKKDSTAVYIGEQGKPPVVTAGKLTPDLLFDFENGAFS